MPHALRLRRLIQCLALVAAALFLFAYRNVSAERVVWVDQFLATRGDAVAVDVSGVYVGGYVWVGSDVEGYVRKYSLDGSLLWTRQFTNPRQVTGLAAYGGHIYVGGYTQAGGDTQSFVRKLSGDGVDVWTAAVPKSEGDFANALGADASGVYIAGHKCCFRAFVKKFTHDGVGEWSSDTPGDFAFAYGVAADGAAVYVGGHKDGDAFIKKYDAATGAVFWIRQFGTAFNEYVYGLAKDATGVYVTGAIQGGSFPGYTFAGGTFDPFVAKVGHDGVLVWTHQFGTATDETPSGIAADGVNVYSTGVISYSAAFPSQVNYGGYDLFVHAVNATTGIASWTRQFGTAGYEEGSGIAVDANSLFVSGTAEGSGSTFPGQSLEGESGFVLAMDKLSNAPPVALDDGANTTVNKSVTVDVLANDSDIDSALQYDYYRADLRLLVHSVTPPANGVAVVAPGGGAVTYSPYCGFRGSDSFFYTVTDPAGKAATANVQIVVWGGRPADPGRPDPPGRPCLTTP
jgi:hypothetical protein